MPRSPRLSRWTSAATLATAVLLHSLVSSAGPLQETWYHSGRVEQDQVERWSSGTPGSHLILRLGDATRWDLEALRSLEGRGRVQIEVSRYPGADTVSAWQALAAKGFELVALDAGYPTDSEVERLNSLNLPRIVLVLTSYPSAADAGRIAKLKAPVSLTFAVGRYPFFIEKEPFLKIPHSIPLLFVVDAWPWYAQMDTLNMIPHPKRLRVSGSYPGSAGMEYLLNIRSLDEVSVSADFEPADPSFWSKLGKRKVRWTTGASVPSRKGLEAFESSLSQGERKIVIDTTGVEGPSAADRARLESSRLSVEWIHEAPGQGN